MEEKYTQRTSWLLGKDNVQKLGEKKILLFGVGGVGSFVAEALIRAGIGHLVLVDADVFEPSNINRQLGATVITIGQPKVNAMKERLLMINPTADIQTHQFFYLPETHRDFISQIQPDYVVDAIDTVAAKISIIEESYTLHIPVISSMGAGNKLHPEQFEIEKIEKTSVDPLAKKIRKELKQRGIQGILVVYSKEKPIIPQKEETENASPGSISFVPGAVGLIIAGAVIRELVQID